MSAMKVTIDRHEITDLHENCSTKTDCADTQRPSFIARHWSRYSVGSMGKGIDRHASSL